MKQLLFIFFIGAVFYFVSKNKIGNNYQSNNSSATPYSSYQPTSSSGNTYSNPTTYPDYQQPPIQYVETRSSSLDDFWYEADEIEDEASSVLGEAQDYDCDDAISAANSAIENSTECQNTNNYFDAESYLSDAQSYLDDAKSYLEDCMSQAEEKKREKENNEEEDY